MNDYAVKAVDEYRVIALRGACGTAVRQDAADPSWWFPDGGGDTVTETHAQAFAICAACPVTTECMTFAVANKELGIWGGRYFGNSRAHAAGAHQIAVARGELPPGAACGDKKGTLTGYNRHLRAKDPSCDDCRRARRESQKYRRPVQSTAPRGKGCGDAVGSVAGLSRHQRRGEQPCELCQAARRARDKAMRSPRAGVAS